MLISYKAAFHLIDRFYVRKSLNGFIIDCAAYFEEALEKAKELEDYSFLNSLVTQRETLDKEFTIFFNYKNLLPTVLNKDEDLNIAAFAFLCVDCIDIPSAEFRDVVIAQATNQGLDSNKIIKQFDSYVANVKENYRLVEDKIGRNELCPCGKKGLDGKPLKYKNCHGKK
jgi:hypothetical protein